MPDRSTGSFDASESSWHRRRPAIRYVSSVAALAGGAGLLVLFATEPDASWRLAGGLTLVALGLVSIPVYAWMDKRRL